MRILNQLISQLSVPAQLWEPDGSVLFTNSKFNDLLGLPIDFNWKEKNLSFIDLPQIKQSGARDLINRALQGMPVEIHSLKFNPAKLQHAEEYSGGIINLILNIYPLFDEPGDVQILVCIVADFTSTTTRIEHELMRSQKMENVETLASGVAHEFNNIFTGIKGMTELIKDEVDESSEIYEFAITIQQNISRGAELIHKLSSFAREVPYAMRRKLVTDYVNQMLSLLQIQIGKRISVETVIDEDAEILIDPSRMDQALANVMSNAKDAMGGQGHIRIKVTKARPSTLGTPSDIDWIMLEIADSGPGIPDEIAQRVLEPFFSTKERGKATGLGLSVTNRIINTHNGVIQITNSEELGGAAIQIFLPIALADN